MSLAVCMIVKDETQRIVPCLEPLMSIADEVIVVDTGSSDGTPELLRERFGIRVLHDTLDPSRCHEQAAPRNRAIERARADWILSIDADERVDPAGLRSLRDGTHDPRVAGYFGRWINHVPGGPALEDYKLFVFRREFRQRGLIHENAQVDLRERGARAVWHDALEVHHHPEERKDAIKTAWYRQRLECAIGCEPHWLRYHWFLGYMDFLARRDDDARRHLHAVTDALPPLFPVECLNSFMVSIELAASANDVAGALARCDAALAYHDAVRDDFEVRVNFRLRPWFEQARAHLAGGRADAVRAYRFGR